MLEAKTKDQGHKRKCSPKEKKKGLDKNISGDLKKKKKKKRKKKVFTKIFQAISKKKKKKKEKKGLYKKIFKQSPRKNVFQKIFQAPHKIFTIQKIVLSSSRGQANFRGLEASRPRT